MRNERARKVKGTLKEELYRGLSRTLSAAPDTYLDAAWRPNPPKEGAEFSPQEEAFASEADETGYGGRSGGGKTSLLAGTAIRQHYRSIIFRREYNEFGEITTQIDEILGPLGRWRGSERKWLLPAGRTIQYGACRTDVDARSFRGNPHDFYGFDELTEFSESHFIFITGWNRTNRPNQRCRIVTTFNPPSNSEGQWVVDRYAPWIDPGYPTPASHGELRWFIRVKGRDMEAYPRFWAEIDGQPVYLDDLPSSQVIQAHGRLPRILQGGQLYKCRASEVTVDGESYLPSSRTFIAAGIDDNPFLGPEYRAKIDAMPEPMRSQLLYGDFGLGRQDDIWQIIPSAWVDEAFARWKRRTIDLGTAGVIRPDGCDVLQQIGCDVARDGPDEVVIMRRYGNWYDWPIYVEKDETAAKNMKRTGGFVGRRILVAVDTGSTPQLMIDLLNVGTSVVDWLAENTEGSGMRVIPFVASARSMPEKTVQGGLKIANDRALAYWLMRDLLDPQNGHDLMLPPSPKLRADLCAPRYIVKSGTIWMEKKEEIKARLGRSTDTGDACVLAALESLHPVLSF